MNNITNNTINKFKNNPIPKLSYDIESVKYYQKIKIDEQCSEYVEDLVDIRDGRYPVFKTPVLQVV